MITQGNARSLPKASKIVTLIILLKKTLATPYRDENALPNSSIFKKLTTALRLMHVAKSMSDQQNVHILIH